MWEYFLQIRIHQTFNLEICPNRKILILSFENEVPAHHINIG